MSDFRLSNEEGFVEDEVEVRGNECTLRGGQESYRCGISRAVVAQRRRDQSSRYRCSSQPWCRVFRMGRVSRQTADGEQATDELVAEAERNEGDSPTGVLVY